MFADSVWYYMCNHWSRWAILLGLIRMHAVWMGCWMTKGKSVVCVFPLVWMNVFAHICKYAANFKNNRLRLLVFGVMHRCPVSPSHVFSSAKVVESRGRHQVQVRVSPSTSVKRKSPRSMSSSKKLKSSDYAEVNSDVVFVADVVSKGFQFKPLCGKLRKYIHVVQKLVWLGAPCLKDKIIGDGTVSLEQLVMLRDSSSTDFFGVSIFTYCDGRWLEYSCKDRPLSYQAIYLENCNGNHYETVVCVFSRPNMQCCYGYCKVDRYNFRKRSSIADNLTSVASPICEAEVDIIEPNVINLRNKLHRDTVKVMSKTKYRTNKSHRVRVKAMSKTKYRNNMSHRVRVKEISKIKYCTNKSHRLNVKSMSRKKYHGNRQYRQRVICTYQIKEATYKGNID
ncbi:hypothetical protein N1851_006987 [Merluccius polli]|uniref:Uncharacterized protein n=1 Tax=Merluccius polli TaxID=89951 RepID=A0AA47P9Y8_MERPO|nr:hypothetical protein N1851_006987 [Merluccius polli]